MNFITDYESELANQPGLHNFVRKLILLRKNDRSLVFLSSLVSKRTCAIGDITFIIFQLHTTLYVLTQYHKPPSCRVW